ncbi:MAG: choline/carnitine O-acyltransferase [Austwickia sp.]|nr:MAG: choline/carnitine O-acyltransferase [Austwickia sp.]
MKPLPVPPLEQTLEAYLRTVAVLQDEPERALTRAAVAEFRDGAGPACQAELERYAAQEHRAGTSWLWDAWLVGYHSTRGPLPLVSNVAFQIAMAAGSPGVRRAARIVRAFAAAYLRELRGEAPAETSLRGDPLDRQQWLPVRGGIRDPRPGADAFLAGSADPASREVVVLCGGRAYAVPVSDAAGHPVPVAAVENALAGIRAGDAEPAPEARVPFGAPGYLDAEGAARLLEDLTRRPGNAATYARLAAALFVVTLVPDAAAVAAHLETATYAVGRAWPFKPLTLQVGLADEFTGIHLEHSMLDGATVGALIARAQVELAGDEAEDRGAGTGPVEGVDSPEALAWELTPAEEAGLVQALTTYDEQARRLRFRIVPTTLGPVPAVPFRLSHDAGCQLVLAYAQLRAYGRLRSTYESVDMREFQGGRTECLRPNTPAMADCARAMVAGTATPEHLAAALAAHRDQVKRCKAGQGIDRHLLGLDLMARRLGLENPLVADPGYRLLTTDFLSTTSLGDQATIIRAAFHPTSAGGIGVYYVPLPTADGQVYEFCLNWDERDRPDIDAFEAALREGTTALADLLQRAAQQGSS